MDRSRPKAEKQQMDKKITEWIPRNKKKNHGRQQTNLDRVYRRKKKKAFTQQWEETAVEIMGYSVVYLCLETLIETRRQ